MPESADWIGELSALRAQRKPCAMVVVTGARGSAPREAGARMIVCDGRLAWGTIGGGNLERLAIEHASDLLARGGALSESLDFPLGEKAGQCCGGAVTLFFETFPWTRRRVVVFGAGHVAQAIGGLARYLAADVLLVDPRDEREIQPRPPRERPYELLCIDAPEEELDALPADTCVLVMTHSHALDLEIVGRALRRERFLYLGLIGSERKWQRFRRRLLARGIDGTRLDEVRCPIGVFKGSKEPTSIAISVAAELLQVMDEAEHRSRAAPSARSAPS